MGTPFNDNLAWLNASGNLSLGAGGDDASADATHTYAKGDCWLTIPVASCLVAPGAAGTWVTPTLQARAANATAGFSGAAIQLGVAGTAYHILVPLSFIFRTYAGSVATSAPHGTKLTSLTFDYIAGTNNLATAPVVIFWTRSLANATAEDGVAYGGTVTYENPIGTAVANLPVTAAATGYTARAILPTPAFINTIEQDLFADILLSTGAAGGSTATLLRVGARFSLALY